MYTVLRNTQIIWPAPHPALFPLLLLIACDRYCNASFTHHMFVILLYWLISYWWKYDITIILMKIRYWCKCGDTIILMNIWCKYGYTIILMKTRYFRLLYCTFLCKDVNRNVHSCTVFGVRYYGEFIIFPAVEGFNNKMKELTKKPSF